MVDTGADLILFKVTPLVKISKKKIYITHNFFWIVFKLQNILALGGHE